jgi:hypothetical protein
MSATYFHSVLVRDPALARIYMDIKNDSGVGAVHAAFDAGDPRAIGIAMRKADKMLPRRNWVAEAEEATKARRNRRQAEDIQTLVRLEAKIAAGRQKSQRRANHPPPLITIDDLKAKGDVIDVHDLRRQGALQPEWTVINSPSRHPSVEKLVAARFRLQVHRRGRDIPQSIAIGWHPTAVCDQPLFRCECDRHAVKLYPARGLYVCRWCAMPGASTRYKASGKDRPAMRVRIRTPVFHGVKNDRRDPATGRFLPASRQ